MKVDAFEHDHVFAARCASWSTPQTVHLRRFVLHEDALEIADQIEGRESRVEFFLPFASDIAPQLRSGPDEIWIELQSGRWLRIELPIGVEWRLETTDYFPRFGTSIERACLHGEAEEFERGYWRFTLHDRVSAPEHAEHS